jgi:hypothetical protein
MGPFCRYGFVSLQQVNGSLQFNHAMLVELVGEFIFKPIIGGAAYFTGALVVFAFSLGKVDVEPLSLSQPSAWEHAKKGHGIWKTRGKKGAQLRQEVAMLLGVLVWAGSLVVIWIAR